MAVDWYKSKRLNEFRSELLRAKTFADRLIIARNNAELSQKALADKLGISVQTYNGYETKGYEPKYEILLKLCRILETEPNDLLGYTITTDYANEYAAQHLIESLPPFEPLFKKSGKNKLNYKLHVDYGDKDTVINVSVPYDKFDIIIQVSYAMAEALSKSIASQQKEQIFIEQVEKQIISYLAEQASQKK